ncbi:MAG: RNA-directed DNA polymerase [Verrucomicrobiales bacterium]|nr:RNA-directed DNA polymerase [Verrucomicrobiales bacterium]
MPPEPLPECMIAAAAEQLAGWLQLRLLPEAQSLEAALESGLPGSISDRKPLLRRLSGIKEIATMPEADLAKIIAADPWFQAHGARSARHWRHQTRVREMTPRWEGLPILATEGDLCLWLGGLRPAELHWLAQTERGDHDPAGKLAHYVHRWIPRRHGAPPRLLASPKPLLKSLQRKILRDLLDHLPLHEAAHGFRRGRSIRSFAHPHTATDCVLRLDLADFFPSIRFGRVAALFETAGYPSPVARLLAGLCCHSAPRAVVRSAGLPRALADRLLRPHLPQGAPTSPALSNAVAFRLDRRLAGLAAAAGAQYTRYADDLAFSGGRDLWRGATRFLDRATAIVLDEGFEVNFRKIRVMPACARQRIAGVVVNEKTNTVRETYDALKAALHRWETRGLPEDDALFPERLLGRISALAQLNPEKGAKLRQRYDRVREGSGFHEMGSPPTSGGLL